MVPRVLVGAELGRADRAFGPWYAVLRSTDSRLHTGTALSHAQPYCTALQPYSRALLRSVGAGAEF